MIAAKKQKTEAERLAKVGQGAYSAILEMVERLRLSREDQADDGTDITRAQNDEPDAERAILEDPLSVQVRSGWYTPGERDTDTAPAEYELLLGTGGPAVRIVGELNMGEPTSARLETQDWGTTWTEYHGIEITRGPRRGERKDLPDEDVLLDYARCFYFGEG